MSTSSSSPGRFLALTAAWLALAWLVAAAAAEVLDVSGLRRAAGLTRASACGEAICAPARVWKPIAFAHSRARTVVLGDSRAALGLDPADMPATAAGAFNLGYEGADFPEVAALAAALMGGRRVDHILIGLDRNTFSRPTSETGRRPIPEHAPGELSIFRTYATSRAALRGVIDVMRSARCCRRAVAGRAADGCVVPLGTGLASMDDAEVNAWLRRKAVPCSLPGCAEKNYASNLEALRDVVAMAASTHTRLTLFINPMPAASQDLEWRVVGTPDPAQWRRDMAAVVAQAGGGRVAPPRDFAVFSRETTDNGVMAQGASDLEAGFLDIAHYSRGMGKLVLKSLAAQAPDRGFGAALGPDLERHLEAEGAARERWIRSHPDEVARNERRALALR